jgi:hypothetical protein
MKKRFVFGSETPSAHEYDITGYRTEILLMLSSKPVVTGKPTCVVKSMNHISLVNSGEVFLLKYLDVQILFS